MSDKSEPKFWLDYLADVLSGRVQNTLIALYKETNKLRRELMENKTADEQRVSDYASQMAQIVDQMGAGFLMVKDKIAELKAQAESNQSHTPTDFSDEFAEVDAQLERMRTLAGTINEAGSVETPPVVEAPDISGPPIEDPAEETPLAGDTGTTNPVVEGDGPLVDPQPPGTINPVAIEEPVVVEEPVSVEEAAEPVQDVAPVTEESPVANTDPVDNADTDDNPFA